MKSRLFSLVLVTLLITGVTNTLAMDVELERIGEPEYRVEPEENRGTPYLNFATGKYEYLSDDGIWS